MAEKSVYTLNLKEAASSDVNAHHEVLSSYVVHDRAKKDVEQYLQLHHTSNPIVRFFKKLSHIIGWAVRLVLPSFLVGHPSLWDNMKTLWKNPQFRPLRMLGAAWLILVLVAASMGLYSFYRGPKTNASQINPNMQTGYYLGTGAPLTINGLGFSPQVLIIKSDTAAGSAIFKTSAMPAGEYAYLGNATADNTENQLTLNSNGFTVQVDADVNTAGVRYMYIAFAGSNCSSVGELCVGTYTGNGAATQTVSTGFQPDLIWDKRPTAVSANFRTSAMATNNTDWFSATAQDTTNLFTTIGTTGFTVGGSNNTLGALYYFIAFKVASGFLAVGTYTGNGLAGTAISGLGFTPDFVLTKPNAATVPAFSTTQSWGDYSGLTSASANAVGDIQALQSGDFVVGTAANSNTATTPYDYFAFGGAPAPAPAGSFTMRRGSYTGTGVAQSIAGIGFTPDLVMIKSDNSADYSVWSTSMDTNVTHYLAVATANFVNGITGMTSDGFSVGTSSPVNTNNITYEYVAFGNASSPQNGAQAQDFVIGAYTGNGIAGRVINGLGIAPDFATIKSAAASVAAWRSSAMAANTASMFAATADDTTGGFFQTLNSDGFTIGNNASVNTAATIYNFFAFKQGTGTFAVGSYNGSGVAKNITGLGFAPDMVWDKSTSTAGAAVYRSSSSGIAASSSQSFTNVADLASAITGLVADGFSVGTGAQVNTSAVVYRWAAWKMSGATTSPNTPTISSPANSSSTVDVLPALTASAYSDPGNNSQKDTQWQVDDAPDFLTPVWTRDANAAETSTVVNASNGTFMSTLAGKTELSHNTPYYWRVRYSNGVWSAWSASSTFTTNIINTPTNTSPVNSTTTTSLSPLLLASAFSDQEAADTAGGAEWQIDTSSAFSSPYYDSGAVGYSNSYSVPAALLSNQSTYYWRVRYEDQTAQWSSYSTPTRFYTSQSSLSVDPLFVNTVVNQGDQINIDAQIELANGSIVNDATATLNIFNPSGTEIVTNATMSYVSGSNGIYQYSYVAPAVNGSYLYEVTAGEGSNNGYGAGNFQVKTISSDITALNTALNNASTSLANQINAVNNAVNNANININNASTTLANQINAASSSLGSAIAANTAGINSIANNLDILLGAFIVTQSSVNDPSPTTLSFITSLTNSADDFYKNAVLTFTSGNLKGQSRRISAYNGSTKLITLDPVLTSAPANSDQFTIVAQDVRVEEQATGIASTTSDIDAKVATIQNETMTLVTQIGTGNIAAIKAKTDTINWSDITGIVTDTGDIKAKTDTINWSQVAAIKTNTDTINWSDITGIKLNTDTINWGDITTIKNNVATLITQIGTGNIAAIKTNTDSINWSDITGIVTDTGDIKAKTDTIDWSQVAAIKTNTDTINWDDVTGIEAKTDTIDWGDVTDIDTKVTDIQTKVNSINNTLQSIDSTLDDLQTNVAAVRTSQQSSYTVDLTGASTVQAGTTYQTTLEISDYQSQAVNASSTPSITIYDPTRTVEVSTTTMTRTATGEYQYSYSVGSNAVAGLWESVVSAPLGAGAITRTSYWQVTGAPAQVIINSVSGLTVPTISADVTITNEGNGPYEYQYQWCVVASESDQCDGGNTIANASAAKLIQPANSFTPTLSLTVPNPGNYWFKLIVTYGGETSAASRNFTAVSSSSPDIAPSPISSAGTTGGLGGQTGGISNIDQTAVMDQLQSNAAALNQAVALLGNIATSSGLASLLQVNEQNTQSIQDIQNKINDLQAVSQTIHQIVSNNSTSPIVQTYMKFDSVVLSFLITNPESTTQTLQFKAFLPQEVKPEDIMNADGLNVDYDPNAQSYFVSSAITLGPGQSVTKEVEVKDIWVFSPAQISGLLQSINSYVSTLTSTQYEAQGSLLSADAESALSNIGQTQTASYDTPQDHIVVYRNNLALLNQANGDITKLQDLVTEAGASKGLLGNVGGIQTFATWGIILAMVFGFGLLAAIIFSMWRHQMMLTAMAMRMERKSQ